MSTPKRVRPGQKLVTLWLDTAALAEIDALAAVAGESRSAYLTRRALESEEPGELRELRAEVERLRRQVEAARSALE